MAKSKKSDVIVSFADSTSTSQVTGSMVLVNNNILLEAGGSQSNNIEKNYQTNNANFKFKTREIDYVFIGHIHIDHNLRLPLIFKRNGRPKVFIPRGNREAMYAVLSNCAMLLEGEARTLTKRSNGSKEYAPLYTQEDVEITMENVYEVEIGIKKKIDDTTELLFINSGHVPFSGSIILTINEKTIYYTSDLANVRYPSYYCEDMEYPKSADLIISEATYASKSRSSNDIKNRETDKERIMSAVEQYDKILFPSFSYHRAQSILTMLYEIYRDRDLDRNIYVDSILLNTINDIFKKKFPLFRKVMSYSKIKCITKSERQTLLKSSEKMIVVSSSGSLAGGASVAYAEAFLPNPRACFVFIGHQFDGTLGSKIKNNTKKTLKVNGKMVQNKAQVVTLKSMSSHIQHDDLIDLLSKVNSPKIALHHSNQSEKMVFKKTLENHFENICKTTKVLCPTKTTKIKL